MNEKPQFIEKAVGSRGQLLWLKVLDCALNLGQHVIASRKRLIPVVVVVVGALAALSSCSNLVKTDFDLDARTKAVEIESTKPWAFAFSDCPPNVNCRVKVGTQSHDVVGARLVFDANAHVAIHIREGFLVLSQNNPAATQIVLRTQEEVGAQKFALDQQPSAVSPGMEVFFPLDGTWISKTRDLIVKWPSSYVMVGSAQQSSDVAAPTPLLGGSLRIFSSFASLSADYVVTELALSFADVLMVRTSGDTGLESGQVRVDENGSMTVHLRGKSESATLFRGTGSLGMGVRASLLEIVLANPHLKLALALIAAVTSLLGIRGMFKRESREWS